ncbi:MAG: hypothetical protein CVU07_03325 [Bacteroidetes bacterium HGW-Bacteroidetes-23]|nr:MAG: hypothetical protein CVU07_03325 [Bacteroidetes bacterium HGW-Bacteroidetes-23]
MIRKLLLSVFVIFSVGLFAQTNLSGFYPSENVSGLRFGTETAMHDNTIVVASESSILPTTIGRVYVFSQENQTITQENVFYPDDAESTDQYGKSISVNEDFIVVGSPMHDEGLMDAGAVYIYRKVNNEWSFFQKITANDATSDKQFGSFVKIQGNSMFIAATNDVNLDGIGSVYVYTFNETEWIFSQKLTVPNTVHLGEKIEIEDNLLVISERVNFQISKYHTFIFNTNWNYSDSTEEFCHLEENSKDFSLENQQLYITTLAMTTEFTNRLYILNRVNNSWEQETILTMDFQDFQIGKVEVSGENMLIGYESYTLQMSRKFPVFYYKKVENEWQMQTYFYGEGQAGMDDRLGNSISLQGSNLVMGAYTEGPISNGKAYAFNLENLSTPSFEKSDISIFPNPTTSTITVQNSSLIQPKRYELFSITGKLLQSSSLENNTISLEKFQSGIYFLKIGFDNGLFETHKIIKK